MVLRGTPETGFSPRDIAQERGHSRSFFWNDGCSPRPHSPRRHLTRESIVPESKRISYFNNPDHLWLPHTKEAEWNIACLGGSSTQPILVGFLTCGKSLTLQARLMRNLTYGLGWTDCAKSSGAAVIAAQPPHLNAGLGVDCQETFAYSRNQDGRIMNDNSVEAELVAAVPSSLKLDAEGQPGEPDAHGQAALLLVESILHALVEAKVLTVTAALSVIETACEVKAEVAELSGESGARMRESLGLLRAISGSFATVAD